MNLSKSNSFKSQILYHGSSVNIDNIVLDKSKNYLDFGRGFYLTSIKQQAIDWVKHRHKNGHLNIYEFAEDDKIKIKTFKGFEKEWLGYVVKNRTSIIASEYDIVIGPVADDKVRSTITAYEQGFLSEIETLKRLKYFKETNQFCFCTKLSLKCLKKIGVECI